MRLKYKYEYIFIFKINWNISLLILVDHVIKQMKQLLILKTWIYRAIYNNTLYVDIVTASKTLESKIFSWKIPSC